MATKPETEVQVVICFVFALLVFSFGLPSLKNPPPGRGKGATPTQSDSQDQARQADVNKIVIPPVLAANNQTRAAYDKTDDNDDSVKWGITLAVAVSGVVVALVQALIYRRQARLMRDALDHSRESSKRELRAYISVLTSAHDLPHPETVQFLKPPKGFSVIIKNSGQTPAYKVVVHMTWKNFKGPEIHWPDAVPFLNAKEIDAITTDPRGSRNVIGSGQFIQSNCDFKDQKTKTTFIDAYAGFISGLGSLFVYGEVNYEDAFQEAHRTEFCFRFRFTPIEQPSLGHLPSGRVDFSTYDRHTYAD